MKAKDTDCYIDVWKEADFRGERRRIYGPAEYPTLKFETDDWGDRVGSLRVGPHAFVMAYCEEDFKDRMMTFGPNDEVGDLGGLKFDDEMDSVKVIDSLKIFDELLGREMMPADGDAAGVPQPPAQNPNKAKPKNRHKGRRR